VQKATHNELVETVGPAKAKLLERYLPSS